jgi:hypothetical protein
MNSATGTSSLPAVSSVQAATELENEGGDMRRAVLMTTGLVVLGYISTLLSIGRCESVIANRIAGDIGHRNIFVLPGTSQYVENRLKRAGFITRRCGDDCFPWAELFGVPSMWPFVGTVTWGYVAAPLAGQGNRTTFLCLFGLVIELDEQSRWVT